MILIGWVIENCFYVEDLYCNFLFFIGCLICYCLFVENLDYIPGIVVGFVGDVVVCNDIGVYEGGEILMYYDLMIVKFCIWVLICDVVIEVMCVVFDSFEVEGIGYNLLFVVVVMDYLKFVLGDMIMVFIVEEYFEGFEGVELFEVDLCKIVVVVVVMNCVFEICLICVLGCMDNYECCVGIEWVVFL